MNRNKGLLRFISCTSWKLISIELRDWGYVLRDKEWDDRQFNFCNDTMRLQFMYAKNFLSSKNWENKHFISLSFYIAKVGGRVAQVLYYAWKFKLESLKADFIKTHVYCNVYANFSFSKRASALPDSQLSRSSVHSREIPSPMLAHLQVKLIDYPLFLRTLLNGSAMSLALCGHYAGWMSELCWVPRAERWAWTLNMDQLRSWHCLVLVTDPCNELWARGDWRDFCD